METVRFWDNECSILYQIILRGILKKKIEILKIYGFTVSTEGKRCLLIDNMCGNNQIKVHFDRVAHFNHTK